MAVTGSEMGPGPGGEARGSKVLDRGGSIVPRGAAALPRKPGGLAAGGSRDAEVSRIGTLCTRLGPFDGTSPGFGRVAAGFGRVRAGVPRVGFRGREGRPRVQEARPRVREARPRVREANGAGWRGNAAGSGGSGAGSRGESAGSRGFGAGSGGKSAGSGGNGAGSGRNLAGSGGSALPRVGTGDGFGRVVCGVREGRRRVREGRGWVRSPAAMNRTGGIASPPPSAEPARRDPSSHRLHPLHTGPPTTGSRPPARPARNQPAKAGPPGLQRARRPRSAALHLLRSSRERAGRSGRRSTMQHAFTLLRATRPPPSSPSTGRTRCLGHSNQHILR